MDEANFNIGQTILMLILAGILLTVGIYTLETMKVDMREADTTNTVTNETYNGINTTRAFLINGSLYASKNNINTPLTKVENASQVFNTDEYTVHSNGTFVFTNHSRTGAGTIAFNITYSYNVVTNTTVELSFSEMITEIGGFSDWFGILIAIAVVAIIIGMLIFGNFG